jgi:hypothetical protein
LANRPFGGPATTLTFDALQSLLDALSARGPHYTPISIITGFQPDAPSALGINIGFTDGNVVLTRTAFHGSQVRVVQDPVATAPRFRHRVATPNILRLRHFLFEYSIA